MEEKEAKSKNGVLSYIVVMFITAVVTYFVTSHIYEFGLNLLRHQVEIYGKTPWF